MTGMTMGLRWGRIGGLLAATVAALAAGEPASSGGGMEPSTILWAIGLTLAYLFIVLALARQGVFHLFHGYTDVVITCISAALWLLVIPAAGDLVEGELAVGSKEWWQSLAVTTVFLGIPLIFAWIANRSLIVAVLVLPAKLLVGMGVWIGIMTTLSQAAKAKQEWGEGKTGSALVSGALAVVSGVATVEMVVFLRSLMPPRPQPESAKDDAR